MDAPELQQLCQLARAIERLFAPFCEVVIHDFADFEQSIIHMEGNISQRKVGGAATDLLLAKAKNGDTGEDFYNYQTRLPNGRMMKSSTTFLRDDTGRAYGAFCINVDISAFTECQRLLGTFLTAHTPTDVSEVLTDDIQHTIQTVVAETVYQMGDDAPILSRDDKVDLIARLDDKGIFQVKKAVPILADQLGLSRATVYNYLREARGEHNHTK